MFATTGSAGQFWYNTTYNHWFYWTALGRWWPMANPDPVYGFVMPPEDFIGTDRIGTNDWNSTGTITTTPGLATRSGIYVIRQASATSISLLRSDISAFLLGTGDFYIETQVSIPTLATASEDFCMTWGWNDGFNYNANGDGTDTADIRLNRAVNGANWITNTTSNSSKTATTTSTAASAATFYRLGIFASGANSNVVFSVNGTTIATHTTNIPTGAGRATGLIWKIDKVAGTGNSDLQVDYFSGWGFYNGARA